jgi:hypothetical protein
MKKVMDPKGIDVRESRDSVKNPESNAIIIGMDVTGSMAIILDSMMRKLNTLVEEIYDRKPVSDPHIMCMGIGDCECDDAPLQVTEFEADIRIAKQLADMWLEGGGGGNRTESYTLPWYFAAQKTAIDCFDKRGKKGYLFTIGDEGMPAEVHKDDMKQFLGADRGYTAQQLFDMASLKYNVYHIIVEQGSNYKRFSDFVVDSWMPMLGQNAIRLSDHRRLPEVIVSAIQVNEGMSRREVIASWSGEAREAVTHSLNLRR